MVVKQKKESKKNKTSNTLDPKITLVGEFRGKNIYIMGDKFSAKEFSEYMELWFQALLYIDSMVPNNKSLSHKKK